MACTNLTTSLPMLGCCGGGGAPVNVITVHIVVGVEIVTFFGFPWSDNLYAKLVWTQTDLIGTNSGTITRQLSFPYHHSVDSASPDGFAVTSLDGFTNARNFAKSETHYEVEIGFGATWQYRWEIDLSETIPADFSAQQASRSCRSKSLDELLCKESAFANQTFVFGYIIGTDDDGNIIEQPGRSDIATSLAQCLEGGYAASWFDWKQKAVDDFYGIVPPRNPRFTGSNYAAYVRSKICTPFQWCESDCSDNTSGGLLPGYVESCACGGPFPRPPGILLLEPDAFRTGKKAGLAVYNTHTGQWDLPSCLPIP